MQHNSTVNNSVSSKKEKIRNINSDGISVMECLESFGAREVSRGMVVVFGVLDDVVGNRGIGERDTVRSGSE